jgi:hypothetical protein
MITQIFAQGRDLEPWCEILICPRNKTRRYFPPIAEVFYDSRPASRTSRSAVAFQAILDPDHSSKSWRVIGEKVKSERLQWPLCQWPMVWSMASSRLHAAVGPMGEKLRPK